MAALPRRRRQPCRALPACAGTRALPLRGAALPSRASLPRRLDRPPVPGAGRRRHRRRRPDLRRAAHLARSAPPRQGGRRRPAQGARTHPRPRRALRRARRRRSARRRRGHRDGALAGDCGAGDPCGRSALRRQPRRVRASARRRAPGDRAGQRRGRRARAERLATALRAGGRRRHGHRAPATTSTTTWSISAPRRCAPALRRCSDRLEEERSEGSGEPTRREEGVDERRHQSPARAEAARGIRIRPCREQHRAGRPPHQVGQSVPDRPRPGCRAGRRALSRPPLAAHPRGRDRAGRTRRARRPAGWPAGAFGRHACHAEVLARAAAWASDRLAQRDARQADGGAS